MPLHCGGVAFPLLFKLTGEDQELVYIGGCGCFLRNSNYLQTRAVVVDDGSARRSRSVPCLDVLDRLMSALIVHSVDDMHSWSLHKWIGEHEEELFIPCFHDGVAGRRWRRDECRLSRLSQGRFESSFPVFVIDGLAIKLLECIGVKFGFFPARVHRMCALGWTTGGEAWYTACLQVRGYVCHFGDSSDCLSSIDEQCNAFNFPLCHGGGSDEKGLDVGVLEITKIIHVIYSSSFE